MSGYMAAFADEMRKMSIDESIISDVVKGMRDSFDANLYSFGTEIPIGAMYGIVLGASALLLIAYVLIIILKEKKK